LASALTPLEVACGLVLDPAHRALRLPPSPPGATPRSALERAILPALERAPCIVSFSGGRDSAAVLAVATHVARRESLPLPVPVTNRFPAAAQADEAWQEAIVAHLRLPEWVRLDHTDELDCVGPVAARVLRRHGLLWPFNAHFHVPILEQARGGSLLTGIGGDEALSPSPRARPWELATGRVRPEPRDALRIGYALAPRALRRRLLARRVDPLCPWLRPAAQHALTRAIAAEMACEPARWRARFAWLAGSRALAVGTAALAALAADASAAIAHPLHDPGVLAALAALPVACRYGDRTAATAMLAGDLLPGTVLARADKAGFDPAFWARHSRAFAARWDGSGIDEELVDRDRLRAEWAGAEPDARSFLLLQALWLAGESAAQAEMRSSSSSPVASSEAQPNGRRRRHAGRAA
jgi:asparagine synthase (glutamine-hydrolysing)